MFNGSCKFRITIIQIVLKAKVLSQLFNYLSLRHIFDSDDVLEWAIANFCACMLDILMSIRNEVLYLVLLINLIESFSLPKELLLI